MQVESKETVAADKSVEELEKEFLLLLQGEDTQPTHPLGTALEMGDAGAGLSPDHVHLDAKPKTAAEARDRIQKFSVQAHKIIQEAESANEAAKKALAKHAKVMHSDEDGEYNIMDLLKTDCDGFKVRIDSARAKLNALDEISKPLETLTSRQKQAADGVLADFESFVKDTAVSLRDGTQKIERRLKRIEEALAKQQVAAGAGPGSAAEVDSGADAGAGSGGDGGAAAAGGAGNAAAGSSAEENVGPAGELPLGVPPAEDMSNMAFKALMAEILRLESEAVSYIDQAESYKKKAAEDIAGKSGPYYSTRGLDDHLQLAQEKIIKTSGLINHIRKIIDGELKSKKDRALSTQNKNQSTAAKRDANEAYKVVYYCQNWAVQAKNTAADALAEAETVLQIETETNNPPAVPADSAPADDAIFQGAAAGSDAGSVSGSDAGSVSGGGGAVFVDADSTVQKIYKDAHDTLQIYDNELTNYHKEVTAASLKVDQYMLETSGDYPELIEARKNYVTGLRHFQDEINTAQRTLQGASQQLDSDKTQSPGDRERAQYCKNLTRGCSASVLTVMLLKNSVQLYSSLVKELHEAMYETAKENYQRASLVVNYAQVDILEPAVKMTLYAINQTKSAFSQGHPSEKSQLLEQTCADAATLGNVSLKMRQEINDNFLNHADDMSISRKSIVKAFYFVDACTYLKLKSHEVLVKAENFAQEILAELIVSAPFELKNLNYGDFDNDKAGLLRKIRVECQMEADQTRTFETKMSQNTSVSSKNSYQRAKKRWEESYNTLADLHETTSELLKRNPKPKEIEFTSKALQLFESLQQVKTQFKALEEEAEKIKYSLDSADGLDITDAADGVSRGDPGGSDGLGDDGGGGGGGGGGGSGDSGGGGGGGGSGDSGGGGGGGDSGGGGGSGDSGGGDGGGGGGGGGGPGKSDDDHSDIDLSSFYDLSSNERNLLLDALDDPNKENLLTGNLASVFTNLKKWVDAIEKAANASAVGIVTKWEPLLYMFSGVPGGRLLYASPASLDGAHSYPYFSARETRYITQIIEARKKSFNKLRSSNVYSQDRNFSLKDLLEEFIKIGLDSVQDATRSVYLTSVYPEIIKMLVFFQLHFASNPVSFLVDKSSSGGTVDTIDLSRDDVLCEYLLDGKLHDYTQASSDFPPDANIQQLVRFLLLGKDVREYILNHLSDTTREELYGYYTGEKKLELAGRPAASASGASGGSSGPPRAAIPEILPVVHRGDAGAAGGADAGNDIASLKAQIADWEQQYRALENEFYEERNAHDQTTVSLKKAMAQENLAIQTCARLRREKEAAEHKSELLAAAAAAQEGAPATDDSQIRVISELRKQLEASRAATEKALHKVKQVEDEKQRLIQHVRNGQADGNEFADLFKFFNEEFLKLQAELSRRSEELDAKTREYENIKGDLDKLQGDFDKIQLETGKFARFLSDVYIPGLTNETPFVQPQRIVAGGEFLALFIKIKDSVCQCLDKQENENYKQLGEKAKLEETNKELQRQLESLAQPASGSEGAPSQENFSALTALNDNLTREVAQLKERIAAEEQKVGEAQKVEREVKEQLGSERSANNLLFKGVNESNEKLTEEIRQLKEKLQRAEAESSRGREEPDTMRADRPTRSETPGEVKAALEEILTQVFRDMSPNPEPRTAAGGEGEDAPTVVDDDTSTSDKTEVMDNNEHENSSDGDDESSSDDDSSEEEGPGAVRKSTSSGGGDGSGGGGSTPKLLKRGKDLWMEVYNFATLVPMKEEWKKDKIFILLYLLLEFLGNHRRVSELSDLFKQLLGGVSLFSTRKKHVNPLKVAEELWVEAFYFAALVPMDLTWKINKIRPFLQSLRRHILSSKEDESDWKEFNLKALFGNHPVLAHEPHFFCGSCIHSYGNNVNKPRLADPVHAYVHETILPLRKRYIRFL